MVRLRFVLQFDLHTQYIMKGINLGLVHQSEPFLSQHKGLCLGARHKLHMLGSQPNHSDFLEYY